MNTADASLSVLPLLLKHGFAPASKSLDVELAPRLHTGQKRVRREMRRFNTASCGRRWGKTFFCCYWLLERAVREARPVAWFAPTFKMLTEVFDEMVRIVGEENIKRKNRQEGRIELKNGGVIDFWSLEASPTLRGRKYGRIVVDEAAHVSCDLEKAWETVIRPTLIDYAGDAFFISTPNGFNFFRTLFERGDDPAYSDWMSWQLPTSDNVTIPNIIQELALAKEEMDDQSYRQEHLAEFLRDEGKVFRNIEANLKAPVDTSPIMHAGHKIVAGVDWAQVKDFTVNSIACATCREELFLDRFNQIEFHVQRDRLIAEWKKWNVTAVRVEENSIGRPNYEELSRETILTQDGRICNVKPVLLTSASKPKLVQSLALSLEKEQFAFLPDKVGKNEMLSYEAKVNPSTGRIIYTAPSGAHDDTVVARFIMLSHIHSGGRARVLDKRLR